MQDKNKIAIHTGKRTEYKTNTKGVRLLTSMFLARPKECNFGKEIGKHYVFDIPSYFFYKRVFESKDTPMQGDVFSIYAEFIWYVEFTHILDKYFIDTPISFKTKTEAYKYFQDNVKMFRWLCVWRCLCSIHDFDLMENDHVTSDDVVNFTKVLVSNSLWTDERMTSNLGLVYEYKSASEAEFYNRILEASELENNSALESIFFEIFKDKEVRDISDLLTGDDVETDEFYNIDFFDKNISRHKSFEKLEKLCWIKQTAGEYRDFIKKLDLTALKKNMLDPLENEFFPVGWQAVFLVDHKKFNYIVTCRGAGKTFFSAYIIIRQLLLPNQRVAVIVPTKTNHMAPMMGYISTFVSKSEEFEVDSRGVIKNTLTGSEARFFSADKSNDSVRGAYANLLVVEEAAFLNEAIVKNAMPLLMRGNANGMLYSITTVDPEVPKNRYYYYFINAKQRSFIEGDDSDYYSVRVDIHKNPFMSEKDKIRAIENGKHDQRRFQAEYMALFVGQGGLDLSSCISVEEGPIELDFGSNFKMLFHPDVLDSTVRSFSNVYICYDMAKTSDRSGVNVIAERGGNVECLGSGYLPKGLTYYQQVDLLLDMRKKLRYPDAQYVIDYTGVGMAVGEIFERRYLQKGGMLGDYVHKIYMVGSSYEKRVDGVWRVGKDTLINKLKSLTSLGKVIIYSYMESLKTEFESFDDTRKRGKSGHFDLIASLMIGVWFLDKMGFVRYESESRHHDHVAGEFDYMGENVPDELKGLMESTYGLENDSFSYMSNHGY